MYKSNVGWVSHVSRKGRYGAEWCEVHGRYGAEWCEVHDRGCYRTSPSCLESIKKLSGASFPTGDGQNDAPPSSGGVAAVSRATLCIPPSPPHFNIGGNARRFDARHLRWCIILSTGTLRRERDSTAILKWRGAGGGGTIQYPLWHGPRQVVHHFVHHLHQKRVIL